MTLQIISNAASLVDPRAEAAALPGVYPAGVIPLTPTPPAPYLPPPGEGNMVVDFPGSRIVWQGPGKRTFGIGLTSSLRAGGGVPLSAVMAFALNGAPFLGSGLLVDLPVGPAVANFAYDSQIALSPGDFVQLFAINLTNADPIETIGAILRIGSP